LVALKVTNLLVYRYVQTSLVTAATWGDPTQVAAGYIALFGSKSPSPPDRPQNFEELAQREKELTAMAGAKPEGIKYSASDLVVFLRHCALYKFTYLCTLVLRVPIALPLKLNAITATSNQ